MRFGELFRGRRVAPDEGCKRALLLHELLSPLCIIDDCLDLTSMTDDACILQQALNISRGETCYSVKIEIQECTAKVLPFGENGAPAQSRLKSFQAQFLE